MADIFGTYIEHFLLATGTDWIMGGEQQVIQEVGGNRNLSQVPGNWYPNASNAYQNGLTLGHWYYNLTLGNSTEDIMEFGFDEPMVLIRETLKSLPGRLGGVESFVIQSINVAEELYGLCSPEYISILNAWKYVSLDGDKVGATFETCGCIPYSSPHLAETSTSNFCPELYIDLNNYYTGTPPSDAILVWSTSSDPESEPFLIVDPFLTHVHSATYYAFYYNEEDDCYSEASTGIEVTIQSCCNVTDNVYISGNVNYEVPMSIGGNIVVQNQGTLTLTSFLEIGGDKGITVENGGTLVIEGPDAVVTVCNPSTNIWNGIVVEPGGEFQTKGGKLLNARYAIFAEADPGATIDDPLIDIQGIEIIGNSGHLSRGITLFGVQANNLSDLRIENYHIGLYLWGGNFQIISGSTFENLGYSGIYSVLNNFSISDCKFINSGIGVTASHNNFGMIKESLFSELSTGVNVWNSNTISIENNEFHLISEPFSRGIFMVFTSESNISNNTIMVEQLGVQLFNSPGIQIGNNNIQIEDVSIQAQTPTGGGISVINGPGSMITENEINIRRAIFGIEVNNSFGAEISANLVNNPEFESIDFKAIKVVGSPGGDIAFNTLFGPSKGSGIFLQNSPGNFLECNNAGFFWDGFMINHNSESQFILGNVLDNTVDLTIRSEIGLQPFHGNLFMGGVARTLGLSTQQIDDSQFFVNSNHVYHMPASPNPGNGEWFIDIGNPDFYECPDGTNIPEQWTPFSQDSFDLCLYYDNLKTLDTLKPNKFFLGVFDLLLLSESRQDFNLPVCILLDLNFQSLCGLQELAGVVLDLGQLGQHALATDSLLSYQAQWVETTDSMEQAQLEDLLGTELVAMAADFENARMQDSILLSEIESDLNAINCSSSLVSTWTAIYKQYISFLQSGTVDSADHNALKQYSSLCSDIYGKPIHLARAVTATFDTTNFEQFDDCLQGMEQRIVQEQTIEEPIEIWPNPTSGAVQISLPENYSGILTVTDISGRKIHLQPIKESNLSYLELPYQNGLYILSFASDKGTVSQHKVLLLR